MLERYRQTDVTTTSPVGLIVKLYDGAMRFSLQARGHIEEGRVAERARALSRALAIVNELQCALDLEKGGEIGQNLHDLYDFVSGRLVAANLEGRAEAIDEAVGVLETLADAWRQIAANPPPAGGAA